MDCVAGKSGILQTMVGPSVHLRLRLASPKGKTSVCVPFRFAKVPFPVYIDY